MPALKKSVDAKRAVSGPVASETVWQSKHQRKSHWSDLWLQIALELSPTEMTTSLRAYVRVGTCACVRVRACVCACARVRAHMCVRTGHGPKRQRHESAFRRCATNYESNATLHNHILLVVCLKTNRLVRPSGTTSLVQSCFSLRITWEGAGTPPSAHGVGRC